METYVCLLIGPNREILTVEAFTVADDAAALARDAASAQLTGVRGYQLWRKGIRIAGCYRDEDGDTPSRDRGA